MVQEANVVIHFNELESEEAVRDHLHGRCLHLAEEFPETNHFELTLDGDTSSVDAHVHVSGKHTRVAAHAQGAASAWQAGDDALDKLERELRKDHDKRIFSPRRKAQKTRLNRLG